MIYPTFIYLDITSQYTDLRHAVPNNSLLRLPQFIHFLQHSHPLLSSYRRDWIEGGRIKLLWNLNSFLNAVFPTQTILINCLPPAVHPSPLPNPSLADQFRDVSNTTLADILQFHDTWPCRVWYVMSGLLTGAAMRVISSEKLLLAIALPLSGCNLIGAGIGGAIDSNTPGAPLVMPAELDSLVQGTRVRVLKKDLTEIRGTYEALSQVAAHKYPLSEYPHIFEQWMGEKHHETSWIPPLGTGVRVAVRSLHGETIYDGSFGGFDPGVIRIISRPKEEVLGIRLDHVQGVFDSVGRSMVSTDLLIHTVDKGVPFANALTQKPGIILREYPQSGIPIDDILEVNPLGSGNCKIIGGCLGLAVDLVIVLAAYNDFQHHGFLQK